MQLVGGGTGGKDCSRAKSDREPPCFDAAPLGILSKPEAFTHACMVVLFTAMAMAHYCNHLFGVLDY